MRTAKRTILATLVLVACARPSSEPANEKLLEEGRAAAARLKTTLAKELTEALQRGGPIEALDVCAKRAQALTGESSTTTTKVGRTSHRLRNPANRSPVWLQATVDALARGEKVEASVIAIGDGRVGYYEPLVTQPMCTTCHGKELAAELRTAIANRYPQDQAVGFEPGDVRGLVWVEVNP